MIHLPASFHIQLYLHISKHAPARYAENARNALALFASTSPSYLILQSLDSANVYLDGYSEKLCDFLVLVNGLKRDLEAQGYCLTGQEPLKITISVKSYGYTGTELSDILLDQNIVCEFADPDFLVLMLTPEIGAAGIRRLRDALLGIPEKNPLSLAQPPFQKGEKALSIRDAMFSSRHFSPLNERAFS